MNALRITRLVLVVIWCLLLLPVVARAQGSDTASVAGLVRDTSGAVLPGVTVEAASPALIEKVRTVVTDGQGLYRIVDLRPGAYTVTFTLPGFATFRRDGLELSAGFISTVNAELKVGALEETVTVSGEAPVVDIQSTRQQATVSRSTLDALPTTGRIPHLVSVIPGAVLGNPVHNSVGGLDERPQYGIHGTRPGDNAPTQDGINQRLQGGAIFVFNNLTFQEVVVETSGMSAERPTGGVQITMIPKDGGNTFSGTFKTVHSGSSLQADNGTAALSARGLRATASVKKHYDTGGALGGPIMRDRLWFYTSIRWSVNQQYQQGNYFNKLQDTRVGTDPLWRVTYYEPDLSRPAHTDDYYRDSALRLTWQAAAKHKIVASYQVQPNCSCYWPILEPPITGPIAAPEAVGRHNYLTNYLPLVTWTYPATNKLLFEAGASANVFNNHTKRNAERDVLAITDLALNLRYGSRALNTGHAGGYRVQHNRQYNQRFAVSYVTGTHNLKVGADLNQYGEGEAGQAIELDQIHGARSYTFRNRVPESVTIWAVPFEALRQARVVSGFVQDQWTIRRATLNLGVRVNNFRTWFPGQTLPAGHFVPARSFPEVKDGGLNYTNVNPRLGASYDLFGTGRTALKVSLGRYSAYSTGSFDNNPLSNQAGSTTRTWNDANGNYVPECDLRNPDPNGECGGWSDRTFGQVRGSNTRYADDALGGFNRQSHNWQGSVSVQHELRPNMALNVGYFRTWYGGFQVIDNQLVTPADYDPYCVTAPVDSRLPGGGGSQFCGIYDIKPAQFGRVDNLVTLAEHYGTQTEVFNGADVTLSARFGQGGQFQGGLSLGRTVTDNCFVVDSPSSLAVPGANIFAPMTLDARPGFCHVARPWSSATQVKFLAVYPLPWDLQASAIYQNIPGVPITASYVARNAEIRSSLGRDLGQCRGAATCNASATSDLIPTDTLFEPRIQQVDLRVTRIVRLGKVRVQGNFDVYNLLNVSDVLNMNRRYGAQWLDVVQIMGGRLLKFSAQVDF